MGAKPIGAELRAAFHTGESEADEAWGNLTGLLGGQMCASLSRLNHKEIVVRRRRLTSG